jgi:hypothetical protein
LCDYYTASDGALRARRSRTFVGSAAASYRRHLQLHFEVPSVAREAADRRLSDQAAVGIAAMPSGSGERAMYPSLRWWTLILDALSEAFADLELVLIGKRRRDERTQTSMTSSELAGLRAQHSKPVDAFDLAVGRPVVRVPLQPRSVPVDHPGPHAVSVL